MDCTLNLCESFDLTLQNLLACRIVIHERRFYFDCGPVWAGRGGLQGIRQSQSELAEKRKMTARWGHYANFHSRGGPHSVSGMSTAAIKRRNPLAAWK
jgi:hypothetical protein